MHMQKGGWTEFIGGAMFSGKTEELIRRARRAEYAGQRVQLFKHALDTRYAPANLCSHSGLEAAAQVVQRGGEILALVEISTQVVVVDECQFFDGGIVAVFEQLASQGKRVIGAGLNLDFSGEPFNSVPELMARADDVTTLHAICVVCGGEASRSQRLIDGRPANYDDPVILVGAKESYEARCRAHHEVPGKLGGGKDESTELG